MSKYHSERNARRRREREFIGDDLRLVGLRSTSRRIYENGSVDVKIKRAPEHYRFDGPVTDGHWSISDQPSTWPEIDKLESEIEELNELETSGRKARMQRKRVDALAEYIDQQSMVGP